VFGCGTESVPYSSEPVISDDNHDVDDAKGILHLSRSASVQLDASRELVVVRTRYFHEDRASLDTGVVSIASADQVNGTGVNLHEKRHPIELTPRIPLRIGFQISEETPTSFDNEENAWVSDRRQMWPLDLQPNHPSDERHL